jgi:sugar lactone lactonase YvrE
MYTSMHALSNALQTERMRNFGLSLADVDFVGRDLHRPECVLCTRDGSVYASDWRGGVTGIAPDGTQVEILPKNNPNRVRPNGIALDRDGSFLLANLGDSGGVYRLSRSGELEPLLLEVEGEKLPPTNFVTVGRDHRVWITVSTRRTPRALGYRPDVADGFIVLVDEHGARIVAEGLGYTNEAQLDASGEWLYVNETFARRLSRFRVGTNGRLGNRETVATFGHGTYPDGLCFDSEEGIWVTSIVSNRVIRIDADGSHQVVLEDHAPHVLDTVEHAFLEGKMGWSHLDTNSGRLLRNVSSLAFGGDDLRTAYLGCLLGEALVRFRSPVPGRPPVHWDWTHV